MSLILNDNGLSGNIPETLGNLTAMSELSLANNQLSGSIPQSMGNLANLHWLDLGGNELSGSIPDSFGNLSSLGSLTLSFNQLSGNIPDSLGNLSGINGINLSHNQLSGSVPEGFANFEHFEYLNVSNNRLSGSIPDFSTSLPSYMIFTFRLDIRFNCFDISPSSEVTTVVDTLIQRGAYSIYYQPQNSDCRPPGDLDGNGKVDRNDLAMLMTQIRARSNDLEYDINGDGKVDIADADTWLCTLRRSEFRERRAERDPDLVVLGTTRLRSCTQTVYDRESYQLLPTRRPAAGQHWRPLASLRGGIRRSPPLSESRDRTLNRTANERQCRRPWG